ncbi:MAG TPA: amidase [Acidimicrobiales bacterium]|jgi:amidase|nr:amidase [Acidimicrobiales bacterium]
MSTFILRLPSPPTGPAVTRIAVKDLIDMAGLPTTCGSQAIADRASPATADAPCLAGIRAAERSGTAAIVGKVNMHELAFGVSGINPWFGTPTNPLDPDLVPGGSSSGSAVAVASGDADVALGSDTGGSVRIPAACCGVVGLKTTKGRVSLEGVSLLAGSLDTVGPMGATVAATGLGMSLLEPGFDWVSAAPAARIGRFRPPADGWVDAAIDDALDRYREAGHGRIVEVDLPGWDAATAAFTAILGAEAWATNKDLWAASADQLSPDVAVRLEGCSSITAEQVAEAWATARRWTAEMDRVLASVDVVALPVLASAPTPIADASRMGSLRLTGPFNVSGGPALALPVPSPSGPVPASLQLAGPSGSEDRLLATGSLMEQVVAR